MSRIGANTAIQSLILHTAGAETPASRLEDARTVCERLTRKSMASTVCFWDVYSDHPSVISPTCSGVLRTTSRHTADCYLSIKAPAVKFDVELVKELLEEASRLNAVDHFDAMR